MDDALKITESAWKMGQNRENCGIYKHWKWPKNLKSKINLETKQHLTVNSTFWLSLVPQKNSLKTKITYIRKVSTQKNRMNLYKLLNPQKKKMGWNVENCGIYKHWKWPQSLKITPKLEK